MQTLRDALKRAVSNGRSNLSQDKLVEVTKMRSICQLDFYYHWKAISVA